MTAGSPGGRPRVSDEVVLDGARRALLADPRASMATIARTAGVGMSAIYLRFPDRPALLRRIAEDGNALYDRVLTACESALATGTPAREVLVRFLTEIDESGYHRLALAIAGTFERSADDLAESYRLRDRGRRLVAALHAAGTLRPGVSWNDLGKVAEALSAVAGADGERSRLLRARMVDIVTTGLCHGTVPLPGPAPDGADFAENRSDGPRS